VRKRDATRASAESNTSEDAHVTVSFVLGIAGLEGKCGHSRFAIVGHNFFGVHAPSNGNLKRATGKLKALNSNAYESTFNSFDVGTIHHIERDIKSGRLK
jgi:uncharacterized FlgJ-related protein